MLWRTLLLCLVCLPCWAQIPRRDTDTMMTLGRCVAVVDFHLAIYQAHAQNTPATAQQQYQTQLLYFGLSNLLQVIASIPDLNAQIIIQQSFQRARISLVIAYEAANTPQTMQSFANVLNANTQACLEINTINV